MAYHADIVAVKKDFRELRFALDGIAILMRQYLTTTEGLI